MLLTQGKNLNGEGTLERAISYMPSLFSCNDSAYSERFAKFMADSKAKADEYKANKEFRVQFRKDAQDKIDEYNKTHSASPRMSNPEKMAKDYGLPYDSHEGVWLLVYSVTWMDNMFANLLSIQKYYDLKDQLEAFCNLAATFRTYLYEGPHGTVTYQELYRLTRVPK